MEHIGSLTPSMLTAIRSYLENNGIDVDDDCTLYWIVSTFDCEYYGGVAEFIRVGI